MKMYLVKLTDNALCNCEFLIADLLEIADRYCESELKSECEQVLIRQISVENVLALYSLGLRYQTKVYNISNPYVHIFCHNN